jgi:hypothetical protein
MSSERIAAIRAALSATPVPARQISRADALVLLSEIDQLVSALAQDVMTARALELSAQAVIVEQTQDDEAARVLRDEQVVAAERKRIVDLVRARSAAVAKTSRAAKNVAGAAALAGLADELERQ